MTLYLNAMNRRATIADMFDTVTCADALTLLVALPDASVDLICTDPPYFGVKKDLDWDNQWTDVDGFIAWLDDHLREFRRVLKPNGSLYLFAAPQHAARVEVAISERFNVLNHISWWKNTGNRNWAADKEAIRSYLPNTEHIIFAEQQNTYSFLRQARHAAGVSSNAVAELFPSETGRLTGCVRNWELGLNTPSPEQYALLQTQYPLPRYEDAIRPFNLTADEQFADVWFFDPIQAYPGKHPCEKPLDMMRHIVRASSRLDDVILDPFCGSGATLRAAKVEGRYYIGGDNDPHWVRKSTDALRMPFEPRAVQPEVAYDDLPLFATVGE